MVGQKVISRNNKTVKDSTTASGCYETDSTAKGHSTQSPVKNPFKRKKRRFSWCTNSSVASKCIVVGFCCFSFLFLVSNSDIALSLDFSNTGNDNANNDNGNNRGQVRVRPAYLNDGRKEDLNDYISEESNEETGDTNTSNDSKEGEDDEVEKGEGENTDHGTNEKKRKQQKVRLRSVSRSDRDRQHKIPKTLIFTHYKKLLDLVPSKLLHGDNQPSGNNTVPGAIVDADRNLTSEELEELTLAVNVRHSIDIHNRSIMEAGAGAVEKLKVLFWSDEDCIQSLKRTRPKLVSYFESEREGMYKADICRGTALLEHGGFYLDVDVGVRHDLWMDLRSDTEFVTSRVHKSSNWVGKGFFQAILGTSPRNPVLERYLKLFENHYDGTSPVRKGPLGVLLLKLAWDQIREETPQAPGITTELYQEFLYQENGLFDAGNNRGLISPAPTWGKRRACHFFVAGIANNRANIEIILESNESEEGEGTKRKKAIGLQVPVLSRIPGSRMCAIDPKEPETSNGYNSTQILDSMKWWERI